MAVPSSRQTLIDYCLRKLGAPVTQINVDPEQVEDAVDDTFQLWNEFHGDGTVRTYFKHQVTSTDIANEYITVPDTIQYIYRLMPIRNRYTSTSSLFDIRYQLHLNDIFDLSYAGSMNHYVHTKQYIDLLGLVLYGYDEYRFNRYNDQLLLPTIKWGEDVLAGDYIFLDAHTIVDPETYTEAYSDRWVKKYLTALIKRQWGANLKKYENVQLPGGVIMNGQQLFDEGSADVEALEEELKNDLQRPLSFLIG